MKPTPLLALIAGIPLVAGCFTNELGRLEAQGVGDLQAGSAPRVAFDEDLNEACGVGVLTTAGEQRIVRKPYLQQMTDRSVEILWTTIEVASPEVTLTPVAGGDAIEATVVVDETADALGAEQLVATADGLEPGTVYCYEIRDASGLLQISTGFRTAPVVGSDEPVRFIAIADLGKQTGDQFAVAAQLETVSFDFALVAGDIAYGSGELDAFELFFFEVYANLVDHIPFYPAPGNHDYKTEGALPYRQVYSLPRNGKDELYYSYDHGNIHVAVIDTESIDEAQLLWLDADLAATEQPWKVVVGHHPPFSSGYHGNNGDVQEQFVPILRTHEVQLGIFGHDHDYERVLPQDGVTYVVAGGGGVGTRSVGTSDFTGYSEQVSHFVYLETRDDTMTMWAIDATGKTFDTTVIHLN